MSKFDATWMPDPLDWDFTGFPGFEQTEKGVVPEPSGEQIRAFLRFLEDIKKDSEEGANDGLPDMMHPMQWVELITKPEFEALAKKWEAQMSEAVAALCSDAPTADQFRRLPDIAQNMFLSYLVQNLLRPEIRGAGSKESQAAPVNGASGTSSVATSGSA